MLPEEMKEKLLALGPLGTTAREAFAAMLRFYVEVRPSEPLAHEEGDMLLFEWGPDFIGLTRQLILGDGEPEDGMSHLILKLHFSPRDEAGRGHVWCESPDKLEDFRESIDTSAAYRARADEPATLTLEWSRA